MLGEPTRDDLHDLDPERVDVDLAHAVDLVLRSIEGFEPEDHRRRWTVSIVILSVHGSVACQRDIHNVRDVRECTLWNRRAIQDCSDGN